MPPRQSPPGRGGKERRVHFTYTPTEANGNWHAYIAGKCQWYECHCQRLTKPCLHEVTGGALECPMCVSPIPTEQTGFQPLYRELDGKPVFVVVHENVREVVDSHRHLSRVLVGRAGDITDGVYIIRPLKPGVAYHSTLPDRLREADIWPTLLRCWKIPALTEWHERQTGITVGGVLHPQKPTPTVPVVPSVPSRQTGSIMDAPTAEVFSGLLRVIREREERADDRTTLDPPAGPLEAV